MASAFWLLLFGAPAWGQDSDIYLEPPSTEKGCECSHDCTTSLFGYCNAQPFCQVKDKSCKLGTASWSFSSGYYDYCKFPKYAKYEDLPASAKHSVLLQKIQADTEAGKYPAQLSVLTGIMGESVRVTFDAQSDVFPQKREKYIHSVGVVAPIKWESVGDHGYTGLFTGADYGFIRLSSAKEPSSDGFTPGAGIKLLRDGRPSANFMAMPSLDGQQCSERNFFKKDFMNHIAATDNFGLKLIAAKFWQASFCPLMVGLSDLADGQPSFPYMLALRAPAGLEVDCPCDDYAQCRSNLAALKAGTALFEVHALATPSAESKLIGRITLTGSPTSTKFGDESMFFKHQYMEDDFKIHPEWLHQDMKDKCGMGGVSTAPPPYSRGCSSPFNNTISMMLGDDVVV